MKAKTEIRAETIERAAVAILKGQGHTRFEPYEGDGGAYAFARDLAKAALEAAGVDKTIKRIADYEESYRRVIDEKCAIDEKHCLCVPALRARIAELEADAERLRWLMDNSGIDDFTGVADDRYDLALRVARERGHDEPNEADELDAFRRLIDGAKESAGGASE